MSAQTISKKAAERLSVVISNQVAVVLAFETLMREGQGKATPCVAEMLRASIEQAESVLGFLQVELESRGWRRITASPGVVIVVPLNANLHDDQSTLGAVGEGSIPG